MVVSGVHIPITITGYKHEREGSISLIMQRPTGFEYDAGDWIDISTGKPDLDGGKTYSLSSSPTEPDLMITFRPGQSPLKRWLASAKQGSQMFITQYGSSHGFNLKGSQMKVLVAGGIGIAPFRSMLTYAADSGMQPSVRLVALNRDEHVLFAEDIGLLNTKLPTLDYIPVVTGPLKAKQKRQLLTSSLQADNAQYYIAGPPSMAQSTVTLLTSGGVSDNDIFTDIFDGY